MQGGSEFRPVGLAMAPDGSLFVSDWVRSDDALHNQGAIWHIRQGQAVERSQTDPTQPLAIKHRPAREAAARHLASSATAPIRLLCEQLLNDDLRVRATAVAVLTGVPAADEDLQRLADNDPDVALRARALAALVPRKSAGHWLDAGQPPAVRLAAVASLRKPSDAPRLLELLDDDDSFMRSAAVRQLSQLPQCSTRST